MICNVYKMFGHSPLSIVWKILQPAQEFEEDHGVFDIKDFFNDFFMGVVRNPRLFHGILKVPFDLKRFWNARPGLTGWVILNISYLVTWTYYRLQSLHQSRT